MNRAKRLLVGDMRHKITIVRVEHHTVADTGETEEVVSDVATVWAKKEDLSGREWFQAQQAQSAITTRFTIRFRDDIYPQMRVRHGIDEYEITAPPMDPDGRREQLQLLCGRVPVREETAFVSAGMPVRVR